VKAATYPEARRIAVDGIGKTIEHT